MPRSRYGTTAWRTGPTIANADAVSTACGTFRIQNQVVLCHDVRELLAGETANGLDDNGNGLIDEPGFLTIRNGDLLELSLSLEEQVPGVRGASATVTTAMRLEN